MIFTPAVKAVAKRDLRSWFGNPAGYVFILFFVGVAASLMVFNEQFFRASLANLDTLNPWFPLLLCLFVPAVTMGTWSSERSHGTQELLFTLPAKDSEILLGKFLATVVIYSVALLFMLALPVGLEILGDPDWGQVFANFFGYWLYGVMLISLSMVGSQFSVNLTVSFILGLVLSALVVFSDRVVGWMLPSLGLQWELNGPNGQFAEFGRGLVPLSGVALFLGLAIAFFFLNLALLSRRHWRQGDATAAHASIRFVAMGVCCVGATGFLVHTMTPIDATVERIHSLSAESEKLIANIDPKRPVYISAFVSEQVPAMLEQQKRNLLNLLDRYDSIGGAGVEKRIVVTRPYTLEAKEAEGYGVQPRIGPDDASGSFSDGVFLGFAVQCGLEEVTVPFLEPGLSVEYELTRSIRTASGAERKTIGVLKTDVELYGGLDFQGGAPRQKERWRIVDELQMQYKVENVSADSDYPEKLDALVVPQPSSLGQEDMDRLQRWIAAGHPTLLLEDTYPRQAPGTAAAEPKGGPMAQFNQQGGGQKGDLQRLLSSFGLSEPIQDVVWDQSSSKFQVMGDLPPEFLFVGRDGIDQNDPITAGLGRVVMMLSGHFRTSDRQGLTVKPLLRSVPGPQTPNGTIQRDKIFVWNPFGGSSQWMPNRPWRLNPRDYVLAARVTGTAEGSNTGGDNTPPTKPINLIAVADLDMIGNTFFQLRAMNADNDNLRFDNVTFILNCIDSLAGDNSLIELRKRRPQLRALTAVNQAQEQFENDWIKERDEANSAAEKELAEARQRLDDAVAKIEGNKEMDANAKELRIAEARENEQKNLDRRTREIEDEKRARIGEAKRKREDMKHEVQAGYQMKTMLFALLPPLLLGLLTFFRRLAKESRNVPANRMVGGGAR